MEPRAASRAVGLVLLGLGTVLAACDRDAVDAGAAAPEREARCDRTVVGLVDDLQRYLDDLADVGTLDYATGTGAPDAAAIQGRIESRQAQLAQMACEPQQSQRRLAEELDRLQTGGAVAEAVAAALRVTLLGGQAERPQTIEIAPGDDLAAVAVTAPAGSTLQLTPGNHELDEPLVVAQPLRIVGAGQEQTRIVSTAEGSAVIALSSAQLQLTGLAIEHRDQPTSAVVVVHSAEHRIHEVTIVGGTAQGDAFAGAGLLIEIGSADAASSVAPVAGPSLQSLERVRVEANEGPGLVVTGTATPRVTGAVLRDNGVCGACYLGAGAGVLEDSVVAGNRTGVVVGGEASPTVLSTRIEDNEVDGIVVEADARARFTDGLVEGNGVRGATVTGDGELWLERTRLLDNAEVGVAIVGEGALSVVDGEVAGHTVGVWSEAGARVVVRGGQLAGRGDVAMVVTGSAEAELDGVRVADVDVGIEVREDAQARLADLTFETMGEVAVIGRDRALVTAAGNRCEVPDLGFLLLDDAQEDLGGGDCRRVDTGA